MSGTPPMRYWKPPKKGIGRLHFVPPMIVKVQIPIVTSEPQLMVLIYNEDRSVENMFPYTAQLRRTLRGKLKSFWYAHLIPNKEAPGTFTVSLDRPAPWQEW